MKMPVDLWLPFMYTIR